MGCDIALDLSSYNYNVILHDLSDDKLQKAKQMMKKNYMLFKLMKKDVFSSSFDDLLSKISLTTDFNGLEKIDFLIENITEDYDAKEKLYLKLRDVCQADTIIGVNTSCISITKIASLMPQPQNVIGMHFLNPAPLKNLVEVIQGHSTSDETIAKTKQFLKTLKKNCVLVNDFPGFVTNRVLMLTLNECIWLVQDHVAEPKDIDKIFKFGFGHQMGPLATADLIGLDTILKSLLVLVESYKDPKYRPCPLLQKMVDAGLLGKKTGKGFYTYGH
jgi:3-hydroxybutyryl-CoA dehydrogenase